MRRQAGLVATAFIMLIAAGCAGGRATAVWSDHDKAGWNQYCTTRAHLPTSRCACYQGVFQNADKTYGEIYKAVLNAPGLATPPPQEAAVFETAARECP